VRHREGGLRTVTDMRDRVFLERLRIVSKLREANGKKTQRTREKPQCGWGMYSVEIYGERGRVLGSHEKLGRRGSLTLHQTLDRPGGGKDGQD